MRIYIHTQMHLCVSKYIHIGVQFTSVYIDMYVAGAKFPKIFFFSLLYVKGVHKSKSFFPSANTFSYHSHTSKLCVRVFQIAIF